MVVSVTSFITHQLTITAVVCRTHCHRLLSALSSALLVTAAQQASVKILIMQSSILSPYRASINSPAGELFLI